jgi:beta-ribofuranosylaminobenzene 5'-phosphate synthase
MPASIGQVDVRAACRLHFGMFSFGRAEVRQFGGLGVMVARGAMHLRIEPAETFAVEGPLAKRVRVAAARVARAMGLEQLPGCRVRVLRAPQEHVGLGTGTQLQLSLAAGLNEFLAGAPLPLPALAALAGRGARSAIGCYGFERGGMIVDQGKLPGEPLGALADRVELPGQWRFGLICPADVKGLAGEEEQLAFRELPGVPGATTQRLTEEVFERLLPAARAGNFLDFSESLYRFNREAGSCFAARQGGAFAGPRVAGLVDAIRRMGVRGTGQSSWGPTVFAVLENETAAQEFADAIGPQLAAGDYLEIVSPANEGAVITRGGA